MKGTDSIEDDELTATLEQWCESLRNDDPASGMRLRAEDYRLVLPNGDELTAEQELALAHDHRVHSIEIRSVENTGRDRALVRLDCHIQPDGETIVASPLRVTFRKRKGEWLALRTETGDESWKKPQPRRRIFDSIRRRLASSSPSFPELAYIPYQARQDFALPRKASTRPIPADRELPIPPEHLWLGYNYPIHGKPQVDGMMDAVRTSGCELQAGDRILDFGCGAGRLIRHLRPLAAECEIWGADISAEHIQWCRRNLSPPFHFFTSTKIPHLPFEDRSFRLIYCGSVFTHIDDLAEAWLLELGRLLTPDGRLYVTIHDEHTVSLLEEASNRSAGWLRWVQRHRVYQEAKSSFDVITIGRDDLSQVFYSQDYFRAMAGPSLEVLSVTEEAYFYQTAFLLKRKS